MVMKRAGPSVAVVVEELMPMAPHDVGRAVASCRRTACRPGSRSSDSIPAVEREEIGEPIAVQVSGARIAAPAGVAEAGLGRDVLEPVAAHVPVQDRRLGAVGMQVSRKCIGQAHERAVRPPIVVGVLTDVAHIEIEQAVVVVVEEQRA
jgi:hypothetical protein